MTLTTQQKIDIIQSILDDPEKRPMSMGICEWVKRYTNQNGREYVRPFWATLIQLDFGIDKYKPKVTYDGEHWWGLHETGYAKRLEVLRCVLSDLQEELKASTQITQP